MKFGGQGHQGRIQVQLIWWGRYATASQNISTATLQDWIWGGDNTPPTSGQYIDIITPILYSTGAGAGGYLWDGASWLSCHVPKGVDGPAGRRPWPARAAHSAKALQHAVGATARPTQQSRRATRKVASYRRRPLAVQCRGVRVAPSATTRAGLCGKIGSKH